jgi:hypothetical protein
MLSVRGREVPGSTRPIGDQGAGSDDQGAGGESEEWVMRRDRRTPDLRLCEGPGCIGRSRGRIAHMPARWDDWVHAIISTYGTWLPGDPRGFRDHDHRVHSSGDYKRPPPSGEHAGLHRYARERSGPEVVIPVVLRRPVAEALGEKLMSIGCPPRILAVGKVHGHILLRVGAADAKPIVGRAKQLASHRVRVELPGTIWAQGCNVVRIEGESHYRWVVGYIEKHRREGASVWIHPDLHRASGPASRRGGEPDG